MILSLDYHNILFPHLTKDSPDISDLRENPTRAIVRFFCNIYQHRSPLNQTEALEFLTLLQERIEQEAKGIIERKSIYYWFHLYRRIGPISSFNESKQTLSLYRNMMETAFIKYGKQRVDKELIMSGGNIYVRDEEIASGHYKKACEEMLGRLYQYSKRKIGTYLGEFGFTDLVEIYSLERLIFEFWHITSCKRRVFKGGTLKIDNEEYFVDADKDLEFLMRSYDDRGGSFNNISSFAGLLLIPDVYKTEGVTLLPKYNVEHLTIKQYPLHRAFGIKDKEMLEFEDFTPNFLWLPIDFDYYYEVHSFMEKQFQERYGYSMKGFIYALYLLTKQTILFCYLDKENGKNAAIELMKRSYRHFGLMDSLIRDLLSLKDSYKLASIRDYDLTFEELQQIFQSLFLNPEDKTGINVSTMGPKKLFLPSRKQGFIVDYPSILKLLITHTNLPRLDDNTKGHLFESAVIRKLREQGLDLWLCQKEITHSDGTTKEIDVSFMYKNFLFIGELKSNRMSVSFSSLGDQSALDYRKMKLEQALDQIDAKALWLSTRRIGTNYEIPAHIDTIVPIVVTPFTEYIWSTDESLWLTDEVPRVSLQSELKEILNDEDIKKIETRSYIKKITN